MMLRIIFNYRNVVIERLWKCGQSRLFSPSALISFRRHVFFYNLCSAELTQTGLTRSFVSVWRGLTAHADLLALPYVLVL